jgi:hypothetical protein
MVIARRGVLLKGSEKGEAARRDAGRRGAGKGGERRGAEKGEE